MKLSLQSHDKLIYIVKTFQQGNSQLAHCLSVYTCKYVRAFRINVGLFINKELSLLDKGSYFLQGLKYNTQVCSMVSGVMLMCPLLSDTDHLSNTTRLRGGQLDSVVSFVTSTELLDQHQEVLDIPSGSNTSPQILE